MQRTASPPASSWTPPRARAFPLWTNSVDWHGKGPNDDEYKIAMEELNAAYAALEQEEK